MIITISFADLSIGGYAKFIIFTDKRGIYSSIIDKSILSADIRKIMSNIK